MRSVVVLPQPDGPSRHTNSPCSTARLTASTEITPGYCLVRFSSSSVAMLDLISRAHLDKISVYLGYVRAGSGRFVRSQESLASPRCCVGVSSSRERGFISEGVA